MLNTCTLIIVTNGKVTLKENVPMHEDQIHGYPWLYIDKDNVRHYEEWFLSKHNIYLVVDKESFTNEK